jgi:hypothetical protein
LADGKEMEVQTSGQIILEGQINVRGQVIRNVCWLLVPGNQLPTLVRAWWLDNSGFLV